MTKTIQKQQRFPEELLLSIDGWAQVSGMDRTAAVNHMCRCFLEAIEVEGLRRECSRLTKEAAELRGKVVALAMGRETPFTCAGNCKDCLDPICELKGME